MKSKPFSFTFPTAIHLAGAVADKTEPPRRTWRGASIGAGAGAGAGALLDNGPRRPVQRLREVVGTMAAAAAAAGAASAGAAATGAAATSSPRQLSVRLSADEEPASSCCSCCCCCCCSYSPCCSPSCLCCCADAVASTISSRRIPYDDRPYIAAARGCWHNGRGGGESCYAR